MFRLISQPISQFTLNTDTTICFAHSELVPIQFGRPLAGKIQVQSSQNHWFERMWAILRSREQVSLRNQLRNAIQGSPTSEYTYPTGQTINILEEIASKAMIHTYFIAKSAYSQKRTASMWGSQMVEIRCRWSWGVMSWHKAHHESTKTGSNSSEIEKYQDHTICSLRVTFRVLVIVPRNSTWIQR